MLIPVSGRSPMKSAQPLFTGHLFPSCTGPGNEGVHGEKVLLLIVCEHHISLIQRQLVYHTDFLCTCSLYLHWWE